MKPRRKKAEATSGARGEALAAAFLEARGYRVIARNLRTTHGEIDLLAHDGVEWTAVEVKARADHPAPEATVLPEQLDRIANSLQALARSLRPRPTWVRIDVVAVRWVEPEPEVRLFAGVRRWQLVPTACGSASVLRQDPADTQGQGRLAAAVFRLILRPVFRLLRALTPFAAAKISRW